MVAGANIVEDFLECHTGTLLNKFLITAFSPTLSRGVAEHFHLGIGENDCAYVASVHDYPLSLPHRLLHSYKSMTHLGDSCHG